MDLRLQSSRIPAGWRKGLDFDWANPVHQFNGSEPLHFVAQAVGGPVPQRQTVGYLFRMVTR